MGMIGFGPSGVMFTIVPIFIGIIFIVVIGMMVVGIVSSAKQWNRNNHSPRLSVPAKIVSRRTDVSYHHHSDAGNTGSVHTTSSTYYYVTFEVESGDRMELAVSGTQYGMLCEGDTGKLEFQGTRYLGFSRGAS